MELARALLEEPFKVDGAEATSNPVAVVAETHPHEAVAEARRLRRTHASLRDPPWALSIAELVRHPERPLDLHNTDDTSDVVQRRPVHVS